MLIGELINRVNSVINRGVNTDNDIISNQLIYNKLKAYRTILVRQMLNQNQILSPNYYQTINVDLKPVIYNGMRILVCGKPIPKLCVSNYGVAVQYINNNGIKLDIINPNRARYFNRGSKYVSNKPSCFFDSDKVYVVNNILMKDINVSAIFEDVLNAFGYSYWIDNYMQYDFCIGDSIVDSLIKLCISDINGTGQENTQQQEAEQ